MNFEQSKEIITLILPPLSALGGVWLASHLNSRSNNKNFIAKEIMLKKLNCYEQLYILMQAIEKAASELFENARTAKTKNALETIPDNVSTAAFRLARYTDNNRLYLDQDVTLHVVAGCLVPVDVYELDPTSYNYKSNLKKLENHFRSEYNTGVELIEDYMGVKRLRKAFKKINKPKTSSSIIEYANELRRKQNDKKD